MRTSWPLLCEKHQHLHAVITIPSSSPPSSSPSHRQHHHQSRHHHPVIIRTITFIPSSPRPSSPSPDIITITWHHHHYCDIITTTVTSPLLWHHHHYCDIITTTASSPPSPSSSIPIPITTTISTTAIIHEVLNPRGESSEPFQLAWKDCFPLFFIPEGQSSDGCFPPGGGASSVAWKQGKLMIACPCETASKWPQNKSVWLEPPTWFLCSFTSLPSFVVCHRVVP